MNDLEIMPENEGLQDRVKLMLMGVNGEKIPVDYALKIYANKNNWGKMYDEKGSYWVWNGPFTCPYELAQIALREK